MVHLFINEENMKIMKILNKNLATILLHWNKQVEVIKTPKSDDKPEKEQIKLPPTNNFTGAISRAEINLKRRKTMMLAQISNDLSDNSDCTPKNNNVFVTEENECELVFSELLGSLMKMVEFIKNMEGHWREHL